MIQIKLDNYDDSFVIDEVRCIESGWKSLIRVGFDTVDAALRVPGIWTGIYFFRGLNCPRRHRHSQSDRKSSPNQNRLAKHN